MNSLFFKNLTVALIFATSALNAGFDEALEVLRSAQTPEEVLSAVEQFQFLDDSEMNFGFKTKSSQSGRRELRDVVFQKIESSRFNPDLLLGFQKLIRNECFDLKFRKQFFIALKESMTKALALDETGAAFLVNFLNRTDAFLVLDLIEGIGKSSEAIDPEKVRNIILFLFKAPFLTSILTIEALSCLASIFIKFDGILSAYGVSGEVQSLLLEKVDSLLQAFGSSDEAALPSISRPGTARACVVDQAERSYDPLLEEIVSHFGSKVEDEVEKLRLLRSVLKGSKVCLGPEGADGFDCLVCQSPPNVSSMVRLDCCRGKNFMHRACFKQWELGQKGNKDDLGFGGDFVATCPNCRSTDFATSGFEVVNPFGLK